MDNSAAGQDEKNLGKTAKVLITFEKYILVISTFFAVISAIASGWAAYYTGQQAELSRQAITAGDRNAAFIDYIKKVDLYCNGFDEVGANGRHYGVFDADGTITLHYDRDAPPPTRDRQTEFQNNFYQLISDYTQALAILYIWLDDKELAYLHAAQLNMAALASDGYEDVVESERKNLDYVTLTLRKGVACTATKERLVEWYRDRDEIHDTSFPTYEDVVVEPRTETFRKQSP